VRYLSLPSILAACPAFPGYAVCADVAPTAIKNWGREWLQAIHRNRFSRREAEAEGDPEPARPGVHVPSKHPTNP